MKQKTLAVIFGGASPEYAISLKSATAVLQVLHTLPYELVMLGIDPAGRWYRYTGAIDNIATDQWCDPSVTRQASLLPCRHTHGMIEMDPETGAVAITRIDAAFPILHGKFGEDGTVQGLLELAGIPIIGCGSLSSAICMDKAISHALVQQAGFNIPQGVMLRQGVTQEQVVAATADLAYPLIVKPTSCGSSIGVSCAKDPALLWQAVDLAFSYEDTILVEEKVQGIEVGCAVMGTGETLSIGLLDEIELNSDLFDFTEKYTLQTSSIYTPARIAPEIADKISTIAMQIYQVLRCQGFARVDFFLTQKGEVLFNEVNTIPGFTSHSRFPNMMKAAGCSFEQLVTQLVQSVMS